MIVDNLTYRTNT